MKFESFLKNLGGNYHKRSRGLKHLGKYLGASEEHNAKILSVVLQRKVFLKYDFWESYDKLVPSLKLDEWTSSGMNAAGLFHAYRKLLIDTNEKEEQRLFNSFGEGKISEKDFFLAFSKSTTIGGTNHFPEYQVYLEKDPSKFFASRFFHPYSFDGLRNLNKAIERNRKGERFSKDSNVELNYNQILLLDRIIRREIDLEILEGMIDAWLHWLVIPHVNTLETAPTEILLKPVNERVLTQLRKESLKKAYRAIHYEHISPREISKEAKFQKVDNEFKTDKGLPVIIGSNVHITSETSSPGALVISKDELFQGSKEEQIQKTLEYDFTNNLYYKYRRARQRSLFPADVEDIKKTEVTLNTGRKISLYSIFKVIDGISAMSDNFRLNIGSKVLGAKVRNIDQHLRTIPEVALSPSLLFELDHFFSGHKDLGKDWYQCVLDIRALVGTLIHLTELGKDEIFSVLRFLSVSPKNKSGFPCMLFSGTEAHWKWEAFLERSISNYLYEQYFLESIYVKDKQHLSRATSYEKELEKLFKGAGFKAQAPLKYRSDGKEVDVVAIKDGKAFLIQVKLSNKARNQVGEQILWGKKNVMKAIEQTAHSLDFFRGEKGQLVLKEFAEVSPTSEDLEIIPLIVSDNFIYDGLSFPLSEDENPEYVRMVSFFELYLILKNRSLLDENFVPEVRRQTILWRGAHPPGEMSLSPDENGNITAIFDVEEGLREATQEGKEKMTRSGKKEEEAPTFDKRIYRKWWDLEDGISTARFIEILRNDEVWDFLNDEIQSFENKMKIASLSIDFRYDI